MRKSALILQHPIYNGINLFYARNSMNTDFKDLGLKKGQRVIVAMSGGVDSSVSAIIAKEAGCIPVGITLKMFDSGTDIFSDAKKVADSLGIEWHGIDYSETFHKSVITYFIRSYKMGETPNPCSFCNRNAKIKYLFDQMQHYDCEKIITGHYAKIINYNGQSYISKAAFEGKDQSYYLSLVEPFHTNLLVLPLGEIENKDAVRAIAANYGLAVANKTDSQDICFLEGKDYREFLSPFSSNWRKGDFILHGKRIGKNKGLHNYTPGQRKGLEISHTEPLYVKSVDHKTGDVYLGEKKEVFAKGIKLRDCQFYPEAPIIGKVTAKLRYRMKDEPCILEQAPENRAFLLFEKSVFAPAPGQTAAIYLNDNVIGGGIIDGIF